MLFFLNNAVQVIFLEKHSFFSYSLVKFVLMDILYHAATFTISQSGVFDCSSFQ
jgi:hypothetical protein